MPPFCKLTSAHKMEMRAIVATSLLSMIFTQEGRLGLASSLEAKFGVRSLNKMKTSIDVVLKFIFSMVSFSAVT